MTHTFLHLKLHLPGFHALIQCLLGPWYTPTPRRGLCAWSMCPTRVSSFLHSSIL